MSDTTAKPGAGTPRGGSEPERDPKTDGKGVERDAEPAGGTARSGTDPDRDEKTSGKSAR